MLPPSKAEIETFLEQRKTQYLGVLNEVRHLLQTFALSSVGRQKICRVFSRKDYRQDELKQTASISEKIQRKRKEKPKYSLLDLEDIVGLRVICIHPQDVERVAQAIQLLPELSVKPGADWVTKPSGYRAYHLVVTLSDPPEDLRDTPCEIQVATMLDETWSYKTHDLIYKGGEIHPAYEKHVRLLSRMLQVADDQSELLDGQIRETKRIHDAFLHACLRDIAKRVAMEERHELGESGGSAEARWEALTTIRQYLKDNTAILREGSLTEFYQRLSSYISANGGKIDGQVCKLMLYVASLRVRQDLTARMLDYADRFIKDSDGAPSAHLFKGVALFYLGQADEAAIQLRSAIAVGDSAGDRNRSAAGRIQLAYVLAHIAAVESKGTADNRREAEALITAAEAMVKEIPHLDERELVNLLDTKGFAQIAFGTTTDEVSQGISLCRKAYETASNDLKESWEKILHYHELLAHRRLFSLSSEYMAKLHENYP